MTTSRLTLQPLEGRLVDKEGPDTGLSVGPGEFVWRPPGSRHAAYAPEGALCLGVFAQPALD